VTGEVVVDTSVAFKWLVGYGETGLDAAAELLRARRDGHLRLIAPATIRVELANTLRYVLGAEDALALLSDFEQVDLDLAPISADLVCRAVSRAQETGIGVYDALFLALAEQRDCPLVTADRKAFAGIETPIEVRLIE
jgi:predicted nucleic acid-binding protein